jgi:hypothetical protein
MRFLYAVEVRVRNTSFHLGGAGTAAQAVRSLKSAVSQMPASSTKADALLAAFSFQALYRDDGILDFLIMTRRCG